jgi:hypothetical protein
MWAGSFFFSVTRCYMVALIVLLQAATRHARLPTTTHGYMLHTTGGLVRCLGLVPRQVVIFARSCSVMSGWCSAAHAYPAICACGFLSGRLLSHTAFREHGCSRIQLCTHAIVRASGCSAFGLPLPRTDLNKRAHTQRQHSVSNSATQHTVRACAQEDRRSAIA